MKEYAIICKYKPLKGFFKKRVVAEYLIFAAKLKDMAVVFQFLDKYKLFYIVAFQMGIQSTDDEALEEQLDYLRYNANVEILEDKVKLKDKKTGKGWEFIFPSNSKYLGSKMTLMTDSRLPSGYYLASVKLKKDFEPAIAYNKLGSDSLDLADAKKIRAFTKSRLKDILKEK